jgi:hypothetical protein
VPRARSAPVLCVRFTAVTPLTRWGQPPGPLPAFEADPAVDMSVPPLEQVEAMPATRFFALAAELMKVHPSHPTDSAVLSRIARIGLRPGESFDPARLDAQTLSALDGVPKATQELMTQSMPRLARVTNGWQMTTDSISSGAHRKQRRSATAPADAKSRQRPR